MRNLQNRGEIKQFAEIGLASPNSTSVSGLYLVLEELGLRGAHRALGEEVRAFSARRRRKRRRRVAAVAVVVLGG